METSTYACSRTIEGPTCIVQGVQRWSADRGKAAIGTIEADVTWKMKRKSGRLLGVGLGW